MSTLSSSPTARMLSDQAHGMRNQLATLRAGTELIDDEAARLDMFTALHALMRDQERAVVSARIELGDEPARGEHDLASLLDLAMRRAKREGALQLAVVAAAGVTIVGPGSWLERLIVDLLHARGDTGLLEVEDAQLRLALEDPLDETMQAWLERLAVATGSTCTAAPGELRVTLPVR